MAFHSRAHKPITWPLLLGHRSAGVGVVVIDVQISEVGDVDSTTIEITFNDNVNSPGAQYEAGVTIKVNAVSATITSATRQDPTNNLVHYVIASKVDINDTVTWEYDDNFGDLEDDGGSPVGDIAAVAVTNYVGSHLYFDEEWDSLWLMIA